MQIACREPGKSRSKQQGSGGGHLSSSISTASSLRSFRNINFPLAVSMSCIKKVRPFNASLVHSKTKFQKNLAAPFPVLWLNTAETEHFAGDKRIPSRQVLNINAIARTNG